MRRMRSILEAYQEIVENDPCTAITLTSFRRLIREGKIPCIYIGKKRLVSMEDVFEFFDSK